jgi:predicted O-linked N-acetylglucosamine transferase (SPINDLY family)
MTLSQARGHLEAGRAEAAAAVLRRLAARAPGDAEVHGLLGETLLALGQAEPAVFALERAARLAPDHAGVAFALGRAMVGAGRFVTGEEWLRRALALAPGLTMAQVHLADVLLATGRAEEAVEASEGPVRSEPRQFLHAATRATFHLYASDRSSEQVWAAHRACAEAVGRIAPGPLEPWSGDRDAGRRLRVAFLSPDFIEHSVVRFFEPLLDHHDRAAVEPVAYFASRVSDSTTQRLRGKFVGWRVVDGATEGDVARWLREDRIDAAIDLAGYTAGSILWPLRRAVVPVQATYLGYPATTALPGVGWRLVDSTTDPAGAEAWHSERLARLDPCFLCFRPPDDAPEPARADLGGGGEAGRSAGVVFGSFNLLGKVSERTGRLWARVLGAVPGSRLLLKDAVLAHAEARELVWARFQALGVPRSRVELLGKVPSRRDHLGLYGRVDIGLDPTPYGGTTTTCEALWMGVGVVTLAGAMHHERVGASLLGAVGLGELVAQSEDQYVALAAALAGDRAKRAAWRSGLRARVAGSALCDGAGFARRFESWLRGAWCSAVGGAGPGAT